MPTTRVEIEQVEGNKWVAELELGGMQAKRHHLVGGTFGEIITEISNTYYEANPPAGLENSPYTQPESDLEVKLAELEAGMGDGVRGELSAPSAGGSQPPISNDFVEEGAEQFPETSIEDSVQAEAAAPPEDTNLGAAIDAALASTEAPAEDVSHVD